MDRENEIIPAAKVKCMLIGLCMPRSHGTDFKSGKYCHNCKHNAKYYDFTVLNENKAVNE